MSRATEDASAKQFLYDVLDTLKERATTYPAYSQEAQRVSLIWSTLYPASPITPAQVPAFMMVVKMVRLAEGNSPDSLTDLVGYAARQASMIKGA